MWIGERCSTARRATRGAAAVAVLLAVVLPGRGGAGLGGAAATPAPTQPEIPAQLSLADALRIFHERGFDLLLADAAVASAAGDLTIARAFPNPEVAGGTGTTFGYSPSHCGVPGCSRRPWNASVSDQGLLFDLLVGKRRLKVDVAEKALRAARLQRADADRTLGSLLKQQYVQAVLAGATLGFARDAAESSLRTADLVGQRFRAGDVSEADAARAETAALAAAQDVDAAQQALASAKGSLAFLLGVRDAGGDFEVDPDLPPATPPARLSRASAADLVALARDQRPDLVAAQAQLASVDASVALAKRQRIPDVSFVAAYQQLGHGQDAVQPRTATFGISAALPLFYANAGEIAKAEAQLRSQQIQHARLDASVTRDVTIAFTSYQSAASRVGRMQEHLLERARRARDLVDYQYRRGAASLLELLDAQRTFASTNAEYYQNLSDYWSALYEIEEAVGAELEP